MFKVIFICKLLLLSASVTLSGHASTDFGLIDQQGKFHQLSRYADHKAVVLYKYSGACPESKAGLSRLAELRSAFGEDDVKFLVLVSDSDASRAGLTEFAERRGFDFPFLLDESQLVTEALGYQRASEVLVMDPGRTRVLYQGALDSAEALAALPKGADGGTGMYLGAVLRAVIDERPVPSYVEVTAGMELPFDRLQYYRSTEISYVDEVAPVLERRCVDCHRENGVAPWSMDSHRMVQGWSSMIRETLLTRRMPPGQIDHKYNERFVDVHYITDDEMATLIHWTQQGARFDGDVDPLRLIEPKQSEWALGEPDMIVDLPPQHVPATGVLEYVFAPVELGLSEDKWVSGYAFDIGDKSALHHVIVYTQDSRQQRQNASRGGSRTNFGGYAPGREYVAFDDDTGILLRRDMRFMIQFHYTTVGREMVDKTRLGLYFHDTPPGNRLVRTAVMNGDFVIPPGVQDHPVRGEAIISRDSLLYSFAPHMHFRGKHVRFTANYPDGTTEELLSIPNFQHNWQMVYRLKEPVSLPAGTVIVADGGFDNSHLNPLNPDPSQEVRWGDQVWDEMFIAWMRISEVR